MVSICVICMIKVPPLTPLNAEHRQLLEAVVSSVINTTEIKPYELLHCMDCNVLLQSLYNFQQTALRGVQNFKYLLCKHYEQITASCYKPIPEAKPDIVTIKIDRENEPVYKEEFSSVGDPGEQNPLEEVDVKTEHITRPDHDSESTMIRIVPTTAQSKNFSPSAKQLVNITPSTKPPVNIVPSTKQAKKLLSTQQTVNVVPTSTGNTVPENAGNIVPAWTGNIVPAWPGNIVPAWPGNIVPALPGNIVPAWPGNIVPAWPGNNVPAWPGNNVPAWPGNNVPAWPGNFVPEWPGNIVPARTGNIVRTARTEGMVPSTTLTTQETIAINAAKVVEKENNVEVFRHSSKETPDFMTQQLEQTRDVPYLNNVSRKNGVQEEGRKIPKKDPRKKRVRIGRVRKKPEPAPCPECGKTFSSKLAVKNHFKSIHSDPVNCKFCNREFRNEYVLQNHIFKNHAENIADEHIKPEWFCAKCTKQFYSSSQFNQHLMTIKHVPREQLPFECETCKKKFAGSSALYKHINIVHLKKKNFECDMCGKRFFSKREVGLHISKAHDKKPLPRRFVCHLCGKAFTIPKCLREHLLMHQGLRPYTCKLCPATFTYSAALFTHNRLKHLKIKRTRKGKEENKEGERGQNSVEQGGKSVEQGEKSVKQRRKGVARGRKRVKHGENYEEKGEKDVERGTKSVEQKGKDIGQVEKDVEHMDKDVTQDSLDIEQFFNKG